MDCIHSKMAANVAVSKNTINDRAKQIVNSSLKSVESCIANRNYGRAFAHLLLILKLDPSCKEKLKSDFTFTMREWTEELERSERLGDLFKCYSQACDVFPECETVLNNIGAQLFRLGYKEEGAVYVRRALRLCPDYVAARQNLENICNVLVDRWHFRMLNDVRRNSAYRLAIQTAASKGVNSILDIGGGTGLLSLYAIESGIPSVYCCERSKTMVEVAKDVLNKNKCDGKVKLFCENSTDLKIPDHIPNRVDMIVTETFDAGLFGEEILTTLHHAFKHLLKDQQESEIKWQVIPSSASVFICGVESSSLRSKNRFLYPVLQNVDLHQVSLVCKTTLTEDDPYTTDDLSHLRSGFTELSAPYKLFTVDFNNVSEIERLVDGVDFSCGLPVIKTGQLDAIVLWFDLDVDKEVTVTTRPDVGNCWEQAVFPVLPHHLKKGTNCHLDVQVGSEIQVHCQLKINKLNLSCHQIISPQTHQSTHESHVSVGDTQGHVSMCDTDSQKDSQITEDEFSSLTLKPGSPSSCLQQISDSMSSSRCGSNKPAHVVDCSYKPADDKSVSDNPPDVMDSYNNHPNTDNVTDCSNKPADVMDCCNKPPVYRRDSNAPTSGGNCFNKSEKNPQTSKTTDQKERAMFMLEHDEISALNDIDTNRTYFHSIERLRLASSRKNLSLLDYSHGLSALGLQAAMLGYTDVFTVCDEEKRDCVEYIAAINSIDDKVKVGSRRQLDTSEHRYDVIVCDVIDSCGTFTQQILEDIALLRVTSLNEDGIVLPYKVKVRGICIESHDLQQINHVIDDENNTGFTIGEFINDFQSSTQVDVDLHTLTHNKLTESFVMFDLSLNPNPSADQLPDFLHQTTAVTAKIIHPGPLTAIVYWFELTVLDDLKVCSLDYTSHWRQAALMVKDEVYLDGGDVEFIFQLENSCIQYKSLQINQH